MQPNVLTKSHRLAVELRARDLLFYALAVASGAVDAISFLALGKVFASFMTGNIVFLGLQVARVDAPGAVAILVSMSGFAVGVYTSTRIIKHSGDSRVWPKRVTVVIGLSVIAHAVFLAVWFAFNGQPSTDGAHVLLGCWALAMGMQSAAVQTFHVEGVLTTAATATVLALVREIANRSATVAERRRHAGVLVSIFVGATAGGVLLMHAHIFAPVLPFVITVLAVATAAIVFRERDAKGG
jgi:uncharacterized membrane protein YoaK (UPF0700 family)